MPDACASCSTVVYHTEKAIGPGRKIYHKACLKCRSCGKRLDSHLLVEHDEEPYCKSCHLKLFGTRDLRHFNHPQAPSPIPSPASPTFPPSSPPPAPTSYLNAPVAAIRSPPPLPTSPKPTGYVPASSYLQSPRKPNVLSPPSSPAAKSPVTGAFAIQPVRERSAASIAVSPRAGPGGRGGGSWKVEGSTPKCFGCGDTVYFAEQVRALDHVFHKRCLRCSVCQTSLSPNKVATHGSQVVCQRCYSSTVGPVGEGYGLA